LVKFYFLTKCFRLESYINRVKENLGFEIIPYTNHNSFVLSFTNLKKNEPERKFLCNIKLTNADEGKQKYSGKS